MPTIPQLPLTGSYSPQDELPLAQGTSTHSIQLSTLLSGYQPVLTLSSGILLGRCSAGQGPVEPVLPGVGLTLAGGVLASSVPGFLFGTVAPSSGIGADGDTWLEVSTGELWTRQSGIWHDSGTNVLATEVAAREAALGPLVTLRATTTGIPPVTLTPDGTAATSATAMMLSNGPCILRLTGAVVAMDLGSDAVIVWDVAVAMRRSVVGGPVAVIGAPAISVFSADASMVGCSLVATSSADQCLLQGVGLQGRVIDWSATLLAVHIP